MEQAYRKQLFTSLALSYHHILNDFQCVFVVLSQFSPHLTADDSRCWTGGTLDELSRCGAASGKSAVGRDAGMLVSDGQTSSPDHLLDAAEPALQKGWGNLVTPGMQKNQKKKEARLIEQKA